MTSTGHPANMSFRGLLGGPRNPRSAPNPSIRPWRLGPVLRLGKPMQSAAFYLLTSLIWGSTWLVITFQLGVVAAEASIVYRFALAALLLMVYTLARRVAAGFSPPPDALL